MSHTASPTLHRCRGLLITKRPLLDDFEAVNQLGAGRVDLTIGSALDIFGGDVTYQSVVARHRELNKETA